MESFSIGLPDEEKNYEIISYYLIIEPKRIKFSWKSLSQLGWVELCEHSFQNNKLKYPLTDFLKNKKRKKEWISLD